jgi:hypothetical protein
MRVAVAAEAITANWLGKRFFDFFPQARTSTSQRVRAIFFGRMKEPTFDRTAEFQRFKNLAQAAKHRDLRSCT